MARVALVLALLSVGAGAEPFVSRDARESMQRLSTSVYEEVVAAYDAEIARNPGDVLFEIRRCDVIEAFAYGEEFYVEEAEDEAATCYDEIYEKYPGNLEVELRLLERDYSDAALDRLTELHDLQTWGINPAYHARIEKLRSDRSSAVQDDGRSAGFYCIKALDLDIAADCRLVAADYYESSGDIESAIAILVSPLDPNEAPYYVASKVTKLANLGAADAADTMLRTLDVDSLGDWWKMELATSLAKAGLHDEALRAIAGVSDDYWQPAQLARARYRVALQAGRFDSALGYYNELRDAGFVNDPLLRTRFELFVADPTLSWRARDLLGVLSILAAITILAAAAFVIPAIVHYRGLIRRQQGATPGLQASAWTLKDTGFALFVLVFGGLFALYLFEYDLLATFLSDTYSTPGQGADFDLARVLLGQFVLSCLLLLPLLIGRKRVIELGTRNWSVAKCIGVGLGLAVAFRVVFAIPVVLAPEEFGIGQSLTTTEAIAAAYREYGFWIVFAVVAILVPIVEEVLFRGVLLQGFARQISFTWANGVQALLFGAMHEHLLLLPFFFALAFVAGMLARRAGGLLPALVLHASFNGMAILAIAFVSSVTSQAPQP